MDELSSEEQSSWTDVETRVSRLAAVLLFENVWISFLQNLGGVHRRRCRSPHPRHPLMLTNPCLPTSYQVGTLQSRLCLLCKMVKLVAYASSIKWEWQSFCFVYCALLFLLDLRHVFSLVFLRHREQPIRDETQVSKSFLPLLLFQQGLNLFRGREIWAQVLGVSASVCAYRANTDRHSYKYSIFALLLKPTLSSFSIWKNVNAYVTTPFETGGFVLPLFPPGVCTCLVPGVYTCLVPGVCTCLVRAN